jgi:hypothetical protein
MPVRGTIRVEGQSPKAGVTWTDSGIAETKGAGRKRKPNQICDLL